MGSCCMPAAQDKSSEQPANKDHEVKNSPKENKDLAAKSTVANKSSIIPSTIGDLNGGKQSTIEVVTSKVGSKISEAKSKAAALTSPKNLLGGGDKSKVEQVKVTPPPFPKKVRALSPGIAALLKMGPKIKIVVDEEKILQNIKEKQTVQEEVALIGHGGKGGKPTTLKTDMFKTVKSSMFKTPKSPVNRPGPSAHNKRAIKRTTDVDKPVLSSTTDELSSFNSSACATSSNGFSVIVSSKMSSKDD